MWRTLTILVSLSSVYALNGNCRVLAIGGGTERGAYQAGVIIGLINNLPSSEVQWDVVTGVGVGALNALIVSSFPQGQEAAAASKLLSFWQSFNYTLVYTDWVGGLITGLLYESGLYDSAPLKKTISKLAPSKYQRWTGVGATDLISGNYVFFNSSGVTVANMNSGILASMAEPGILPFVNYQNKMQLVSGSLKFSLDILDAVNGCAALGYSQNQVIVHAVMAAGRSIKGVNAADYKTIQATFRYAEIAAYELFEQTIENAEHDFPGVNLKYIISPKEFMNSTVLPYEYTQAELDQQLEFGQNDAKKIIGEILATSR